MLLCHSVSVFAAIIAYAGAQFMFGLESECEEAFLKNPVHCAAVRQLFNSCGERMDMGEDIVANIVRTSPVNLRRLVSCAASVEGLMTADGHVNKTAVAIRQHSPDFIPEKLARLQAALDKSRRRCPDDNVLSFQVCYMRPCLRFGFPFICMVQTS